MAATHTPRSCWVAHLAGLDAVVKFRAVHLIGGHWAALRRPFRQLLQEIPASSGQVHFLVRRGGVQQEAEPE
jgi:hypothetical protein